MDMIGVLISYFMMGISIMLLAKIFKNGIVDGLNKKRLLPYILFTLVILVTAGDASHYFESVGYLKRELVESSEYVSIFSEALKNQISLCRKLGWQLTIQNSILIFACLEILEGIRIKMELKSKINLKSRWNYKEILKRI